MKRIISGHVGCSHITSCGEEDLGVQTTGKRTLWPKGVAREACIDGVTAGALLCWAGELLVLLAMSCRVPFKMYADLTQSIDTKSCLPGTTILNILSVRAMILCRPLYCGSKARSMAFCCRKTCVEFLRSLWMNVVVGCTRFNYCR